MNIKKCLSVCLSVYLFALANPVICFAADETTALYLTKVIEVDEKVPEPTVDFEFNIRPAATNDELSKVGDISVNAGHLQVFKQSNSDNKPYQIIFGTSKESYNDVKFLQTQVEQIDEDSKNYHAYSRTGQIELDKDYIAKMDAGIYRYVATESQHSLVNNDADSHEKKDQAFQYDGMRYSEEEFYIDLFIFAKGKGDPQFVVHKPTEAIDSVKSEVKNTLCFTSNFKYDAAYPDYGARSVKITNKTEGNLSDPAKGFVLKIQPYARPGDGQQNRDAETYLFEPSNPNIEIKNATKRSDGLYAFKLGDSPIYPEVTLKNEESVTIYGLSHYDAVDVYESGIEFDYDENNNVILFIDGYQIDSAKDYYFEQMSPLKLAAGGSLGKTMLFEESNTLNNGDEMIWTHTRNITGPTGLLLTTAPYIALTALAAGGILLFARRRKSNVE